MEQRRRHDADRPGNGCGRGGASAARHTGGKPRLQSPGWERRCFPTRGTLRAVAWWRRSAPHLAGSGSCSALGAAVSPLGPPARFHAALAPRQPPPPRLCRGKCTSLAAKSSGHRPSGCSREMPIVLASTGPHRRRRKAQMALMDEQNPTEGPGQSHTGAPSK